MNNNTGRWLISLIFFGTLLFNLFFIFGDYGITAVRVSAWMEIVQLLVFNLIVSELEKIK